MKTPPKKSAKRSAPTMGNGTSVGTNNKNTFLLRDHYGNKLNVRCGQHIEGDPDEVYYNREDNYFYYFGPENRFKLDIMDVPSSRASLYTMAPDPKNWANTPIPNIAFVLKDFLVEWDDYKKEMRARNQAVVTLQDDTIPAAYRNELKEFLEQGTELEPFEEEQQAFELLKDTDCSMVRGKAIYVPLKEAFVVMPQMDGDLDQLKNLHYNSIVGVVKRYAEMLECLWKKNLVYTDIKGVNVAYRCVGDDRFELQGIDVGDVFKLKKGDEKKDYVATYPYYHEEACDEFDRRGGQNMSPYAQKKLMREVTGYFHRIEGHPITLENAETHMVWGTAVMAAMLVEHSWWEFFTWKRDVTTAGFQLIKERICEKLKKAVMATAEGYTPDKAFWDLVCKALMDPTTVTLKQLGAGKTNEVRTPKLNVDKKELKMPPVDRKGLFKELYDAVFKKNEAGNKVPPETPEVGWITRNVMRRRRGGKYKTMRKLKAKTEDRNVTMRKKKESKKNRYQPELKF